VLAATGHLGVKSSQDFHQLVPAWGIAVRRAAWPVSAAFLGAPVA